MTKYFEGIKENPIVKILSLSLSQNTYMIKMSTG